MNAASISELVKRAAIEAGFDLAGIATVEDAEFPELARFPEWLERGHAGDMEYLKARDSEGRLKRASLRHAAPWARSVIVCARSYDSPHPLSTECDDPRCGWIARYAWTDEDYHDSMMRRLRVVEEKLLVWTRATSPAPGAQAMQTRCYVDTGPIVERVYARHAGVGWIGKNTCLINEQRGSFTFLGVILSSLPLVADVPAADRCGACTRCIDACPTQALVAPGELDSRRCISYLTIEKRGAIDEDLRAGMGRHLFGCDICQDVCPWNQKARRVGSTELQSGELSAGHEELEPRSEIRPELVNPALDWLASFTLDDFRCVFRGSPVKRTRFTGFRRNLAIAMGNSGEREYLPMLEAWSQDADPVVVEHARWAMKRLRAGEPVSEPMAATGD